MSATHSAPVILLLSVVCVASALGAEAVNAAAPRSPEDVVRADAAALSAGDLEAFLALYHPEVKIFGLPSDPHALVGALLEHMQGLPKLRAAFAGVFAKRPLARLEVADTFAFADLVVAKVVISDPPRYDTPTHVLAVYRIAEGKIRDLWHVAETKPATVRSGPAPEAVLRRLMDAGNRLDLEGWLGLFDSGAHQWKRATDPDQLANVPSTRAFETAGRRVAYTEAFAATPHPHAEIEHTITVGDHVASVGSFRFPELTNHTLTIYRVVDGLLLDIWDVAQRKEAAP